MGTFALWQSIILFWWPGVSVINMEVFSAIWRWVSRLSKYLDICTFSIIFAKHSLIADTLLILALPSFRSLWLLPMSMLSFSPKCRSRSWLPKIWCGLLHWESSWMHLKPAVCRVPSMDSGSSMLATRFRRLHGLIAAHKLLSNLRKRYQMQFLGHGRR